MFDKLKSILSRLDADYADIRYEVKKDTIVSFSGKELTEIGANSTDGFVIRALKDGGMASVVFTKETDAEKAVRSVMENARLIAKNAAKPATLAEVELVQDAYGRGAASILILGCRARRGEFDGLIFLAIRQRSGEREQQTYDDCGYQDVPCSHLLSFISGGGPTRTAPCVVSSP